MQTWKKTSIYIYISSFRHWYSKGVLFRSMGYQQCALDQCLFVDKGAGNQLNMILVYVDDITVLSADDMHIDEVFAALKTKYAMQDLGDLQYYGAE